MARTPIFDRFTRWLAAGNLYFAGKHTNSFYEWQGFVEGAALSGIHTVDGRAYGRGGEVRIRIRRDRP
jgi:hypothetical protein